MSAASPTLSAEPYAATLAVYEGYLDNAACDKIYGWAWDQSLPNTAIRVDILDGSTLLQTVTAGDYRVDLPGNKYHGFGYVPPTSLKDGRTHSIYARFSGTNTYLTHSPRSLTCAPPAPTISSYSWNTTPTENQSFGGSVSGAGFISGGTQVFFCPSGSSTCYQHPSAGVSVNGLTSLSLSGVNLSAGSWQFYAQTSSGQSSRSSSFTVQASAQAPTINGYSWNTTPAAGQPFGGSISGSGFASGARVFFCVNGTATCYEHPSAGISVNSSTSLSVSNVSLGGGTYQIYVQTSVGQSARSSAFNVLSPPTITGYSWSTTPSAGQSFGGTVNGTNFVSGARLFLCVSGTNTCYEHPSSGIAVNGSTSLSVSNMNAGAGSYQLYVQTAAGQSARSASFTVQAAPAPMITGYAWNTTPAPGQPFGGVVTGTGFASGARVFFCVNATTTCYEHPSAGVSVSGPTSLSVSNVSLGAGTYQLYVQTAAGASARSTAFNVQAPSATINGYSWSPAPTANQFFGGSISGSGFVSGTRVFFCANGTSTCYEHPQAGVTVGGSTSLSLINVSLGGGSWQFYVQTPAGQSARSSAFTVQSTPPPVVTSISPSAPVSSGSDQNITVSGGNFQQNLTVSVTFPGGGGGTLGGTQIQGVTPSSFVMRITVGSPGAWVMRVNNPDGTQSAPFNFNVQSGVQSPAIFSLNPSVPFAAGNDQDVVVSGSNFQPNLTVSATFPNGGVGTLSGAQVQNITPSSFVLRITLGAAGAWSLRVNNPDGGQSPPFGFSVSPGAQGVAVTSLNPASPTAGGADQNVTVNGAGFQPGLRVNVTFPDGGVGTLQGTGQIQNVNANSFLMRITANAAGGWMMRVVNPDGTQSGQFPFNVQTAGPPAAGLPSSVLSPVLGALRVTTSNLGTRDGRWEFNQYKSGYHTPTGGISLSNDTYAWDVNLYTETSGNADAGKAVYAVADGEVVSYVGTPPGGGPGAVLVAHPNRTSPVWFSGYLHMTNVRVALNQAVNPTTVLGDVGRVGANNDHLHFVVYSGQNTRGNLRSFDVAIAERLSSTANQPAISLIEPRIVNQSSEPQQITISGANFVAESIVEAQDPNGHSFTLTRDPMPTNGGQIIGVTATLMTVQVPFVASGNYQFAVINRPSGAGVSGAGSGPASAGSFAASGSCGNCTIYAKPSGRTPVVLIPGIMGSRLAKRQPDGSLPERWPATTDIGPFPNDKHEELATEVEDPAGYKEVSSRGIVATEVIRNITVARVNVKEFYGKLIDYLRHDQGYTLYDVPNPTLSKCDLTRRDADLFVFPYDWRNSNFTSARDLWNYVQCIKSIRGNPANFKVHIIAHSMGGLVARRYILSNPTTHHVERMVTLGTPWLGAPTAINIMETGNYEGINRLINSGVLKKIAPAIKGAHELLPSRTYDDDLDHLVLGEDGWNDFDFLSQTTRWYDYNRLKTVANLRYPPNSPGTTNDTFHTSNGQDKWASGNLFGVDYYNFVGTGVPTIGTLVAKKNLSGDNELAPLPTTGDGTVPLASALRYRPSRPDLPSYKGPIKREYQFNLGHTELVSDGRTFPFIRCVVNVPDAEGCINKLSAPSLTFGPNVEGEAAGDTNYFLQVAGSQTVLISDAFGNTISPLSTSIDEGVRTVHTDVTGDSYLSASLPLDQNYRVVLKSPAKPFSLLLTKGDAQTITQAVRYVDVTLPPGVSALLELTPQEVSALRYDGNGDGTFETTVAPTASVTGAEAQDVEPPVMTFGEATQGATAQVTLAATDAGTGVRRIMYSVDGKSYQPYSAPLSLDPSLTPVVYAFADDNVANRSGLQTFQLTPGSLRLDSVSPPAGRASGGQQVRLTGSFPNLSTVTLGGTPASWSYTNGFREVTLTTPSHAPGAVSVVLTPAAGNAVTKPNAFAYLPTAFTDNTLLAGVTTAKAQHVIELRQAVDALRAAAGLAPAAWTEPTLAPASTIIKPVHVNQLRAFLEEAAARLGHPPAVYTDPSLGAGAVIRRVHIEELRQRIRAIAGG